MHRKTAIRNAMIAALETTQTAGANVYVLPHKQLSAADTPSISISTGDRVQHEEQTIGTAQTRVLQSSLIVQAICINAETDTDECDVQDILDQVELEIERALHVDETLGGTIESIEFVDSGTELDIDSEAKYGALTLNYALTFTVDRTDPE